ncbi:fumarylacetoacetate hydrolase family protein [Roseateles sp. DB2]|uniref:fumarylacetoacetate hydrolase family protein n=1 Tax=Roseateles sp. DB2 TaxID=3453717 RepID=UPI003EEA7846
MKLMRWGVPGAERPGLVDEKGLLRDLSAHCPSLDGAALAPQALDRLRRLAPSSLPLLPPQTRLGLPWSGMGKFLCVGLNYADHAAEAGMALPAEPVLFMKPPSCAIGAGDAVWLPRGSSRTDWEVELGVVIGRQASYVDEAQALSCVAGYCVVNDISEREYQLERGGTWDKGKGCDTFGPVGPWLVTADEVPHPQDLTLWLDLNGQPMQRGSTRTMVFGVAQLVSYISRFMTLYPGDLISTGTPPGVGMGRKPQPVYLREGDEMRLGVQGLGEQRLKVQARPQS